MIPVLLDRLCIKIRGGFTRERVEGVISACGGRISGQMNAIRWVVVEIDPRHASDVFQRYESHPDVEWVDFDQQRFVTASVDVYHDGSSSASLLDLSPAMARMGVYHAWKHSRGAATCRVAVGDTGMVSSYATWPAFAGKDMVISAVSALADPWEPKAPGYIHGTASCATIAGNDTGLTSGIAPGCPIAFVRMTLDNGMNTNSLVAEAVAIIADNAEAWGVKVLNMSMAGLPEVKTPEQYLASVSDPLVDALKLLGSKDVVHVWSAGNFGNNMERTGWTNPSPAAPACGAGICAGATTYEDDEDRPVKYTTHGSGVTLVAPAHKHYTPCDRTNVLPTTVSIPAGWVDPKGIVTRVDARTIHTSAEGFNGTSCAAPLISGVAALVRSANPALTALQTREILLTTADKGRHPLFYEWFTRPGVGVVNAGRAVLKAKSIASPGVVFPWVQFFGRQGFGARVRVSGGVPTTHLRGAVDLEVTGFCANPAAPDTQIAITNVRVYAGATLVYDGAPRTTWTGLMPFAAARLDGARLRVVVTAANGASADVEYTDIVGYAVGGPPPRTTILTPEGPASVIEFEVDGLNPPFTTEASWDDGAWTAVSSPIAARSGSLRLRSSDCFGAREGG